MILVIGSRLIGRARILLASCLLASGCCSVDEIRASSPPPAYVGEPYSFAVEHNCSGESTTDSWRLQVASGSLPPGVEFSREGRFSGTPTTSGTFAVTVELLVSEKFEAPVDTETVTIVVVAR